jgi:hypothetical protein
LFNLAAGASLVLFLATAVMWARSYWWFDAGDYVPAHAWYADRQVYNLYSGNGAIVVSWDSRHGNNTRTGFSGFHGYPSAAWAMTPQQTFSGNSFLGFGFDRTKERNSFLGLSLGQSVSYWEIIVPWWSLVSATAVLPALRLRAHWRLRQRCAVGLCPTCGYDLRATPDRCPECGAVPSPADSLI